MRLWIALLWASTWVLCHAVEGGELSNPTAAGGDPARHVPSYLKMIERNPVEGPVLDRLWEAAGAKREDLLLDYHKRAVDGDGVAAIIYAHLLRKGGHLDEAELAYEAAAGLLPTDVRPWLSLAKLRAQRGHAPEAVAAYEAAIERLAPRDPLMLPTLLSLGEECIRAKLPEKAAEAWERATALEPSNIDLRRQLAALCEKNGLPDRAIEHYTEIARSGSAEQKSNATLALSRLFEGLGQADNAIDVLQRGLEITAADNWLHAELLARLIAVHRNAGTLDTLERSWVESARKNDRDPAVLSRLVSFYRETGNAPNELLWITKSIDLNPRDAALLRRAARLAADTGDNVRALAFGQRLLEMDESNLDVAFFVAEIQLRQDSSAAAEKTITDVLEKGGSSEDLAQAAGFFVQHRMWHAAESALIKASDKVPADREAIRALAEFYFDRNRPDEGRKTVERLIDPVKTPAEQAAQMAVAAEILKVEGQVEGAAVLLQRAVELFPTSASREQLANALSTIGRRDEATEQLKLAIAESRDASEKAGLDRSLYALLVSVPSDEAGESITVPGLGDVPLGSGRPSDAKRILHSRVAKELNERRSLAGKEPTEDNRLAFARWQALARQHAEAVKTARLIQPPTRTSLEFIAETAAEGGAHDDAIAALNALRSMLTRDEAAGIDRKIGRALLDAGRNDDAIELYRKLVEADPGSPRTLADLAEALQRASRWQEALDAWQIAFDRSRPGDRDQALKSYARALTQLGRPADALTVIDAELDFIKDDTRRERTFQEVLQFARRNNLIEEYRRKWEERVATKPDNAFARAALATILKKSGEEKAAFDLLTVPTAQADGQKDLQRKVDAAMEFGDYQTAIDAQTKMLALDETPQNRMRLAKLQFAHFDVPAAEATWRALVEREPRDVDVLLEAAAFWNSIGRSDEQIALLNRAIAIDANMPSAQYELGEALLRGGRIDEARKAFAAVLAATRPIEGPFEPPVMPPAGVLGPLPSVLASAEATLSPANSELGSAVRDLARRGGGITTKPGNDPGWRLAAIRRLATHLDDSHRDEWIKRWTAQSGSIEALHALHYAGANEQVNRDFLQRLEKENSNEMRFYYMLSVLDRRDYKRFGAWLREVGELPRRQLALAAIATSALWRGNVEPELMESVFPSDFLVRETLWQAAQLIADSGDTRLASELGTRAFGNELYRREDVVTVAKWEASCGRIDAAKALLEKAALEQSGRVMAAPSFNALRVRYLMESPSDAASFGVTFLERTDAKDPVRLALTRLLLGSLGNDAKAKRGAIDALVSAQPFGAQGNSALGGAGPSLSLLLSAALTLREWDFVEPAAALLDAALADEARLTLLDEPARLEAEQARLFKAALDAALCPEDELPVLLARQAQRGEDWFQAIASQLEAMRQPARAGSVNKWMIDQGKGNENLVRSAAISLANGGRLSEARDVFVNAIASGEGAVSEPAVSQIAAELAAILDAAHDSNGAILVLERALKKQPRDSELRRKHGALLLAAGEPRRAADLLLDAVNGDPGDWPSRIFLASALESMERYDEALKALGLEPGGDFTKSGVPQAATVAAARIGVKRGDAFKVIESRRALTGAGATRELADAARSIHAGGKPNDAMTLAAECFAGAPAHEAFPLLEALLDFMAASPAIPGGMLWTWIERGSDASRDSMGNVAPEFARILKDLALRYPDRAEFREFAVQLGEAGNLHSRCGELIAVFDALKDSARIERLVAAIRSVRRHSTLNVREAIAALHAINRHDLALELATHLCEIRPAELDSVLTRTLSLQRSGSAAGIDESLADASVLAAFDPTGPGRIALCLMELGRLDDAKTGLMDAIARDPLNIRPWMRESLARLHARDGNEDGMAQVIAQNPMPELAAEYAVKFGKLDDIAKLTKSLGIDDALQDWTGVQIAWRLLGEKRASDAAVFVEKNPRLLSVPGFPLSELTSDPGEQAPALAAAMEQCLAEHISWPLQRTLAALYSGMASGNSDKALNFLIRAEQLQPQTLAYSRQRADLLASQSRKNESIDVLKSYIARTQSPSKKAEAETLLAKLGGAPTGDSPLQPPTKR